MLKAQWMAIRAGFAALCGCAVTGALAGGTVPVEWNVTPLKSGAYIETFATVPEWATAVGSSTQAVKSAVATVSYSRVNDWFDNATTALALDTEGEDINNALTNGVDGSTSVATTDVKPVYIDMLVRFDALEDEPDTNTLSGAKLALYMNTSGNLVCYSNDGFATNSTEYSTNEWNRVTVKLAGESFQVFMNDGADPLSFGSTDTFMVKGGRGLTTGTLSGTTFRGTGYLADLYVGYCDPKYGVAGATEEANKLLTAATVSELNNVTNVTKIQKWMADNKTNVPLDADDANILKGYMLGANAPVSSADLSITSIDVVSPTQVKVKVGLAIGGEAKTGSINGVLRLEGAITEGGAYTLLNETVVTDAEFESGNSAEEYTFDIPADGYHIFKPVLSVQ